MSKHVYNLKRQDPDERDFQLSNVLNPHAAVTLPKSVDLRPKNPPIFDQKKFGACTAHAGVRARMMLTNEKTMLSRMYQYIKERIIEGTQGTDSGAQMRDIGKAIFNNGICPEIDWAYIESNLTKTPSATADHEAIKFKISSYHSVPDLDGIKQVLALKQQPVLIGIDVYESFESPSVAKTGIIPMPKKGEKLLGGHAILGVGYDDVKQWVIIANSWGNKWGDKGYCYIPYAYFTKGYASDFWIISL